MQIPASQWIDAVAARLRRQWPTIEAARLDDLALDLWQDERLRSMKPNEAADEWLRPILA